MSSRHKQEPLGHHTVILPAVPTTEFWWAATPLQNDRKLFTAKQKAEQERIQAGRFGTRTLFDKPTDG
jgi:hypothetical protein